MKINTKSQHFAAFSAFLLCSQIMFNPLYKVQNKIATAALTLITGLAANYAFTYFYGKCRPNASGSSALSKITGVISAILLCVLSAVFANEFLNAASLFSDYYSNNATSLLFLAVMLFCCAYAGFSSTGGIMRFCSLCCLGFVLYFALLFFGLITLGDIVIPNSPDFSAVDLSFFKDGTLSALYFVFDIPIFFLCCISENSRHNNIIMPEVSRAAFRSALVILCVNCMRTTLMFGKKLSADLYSCDLTALTLIPHFSFPEIYLFVTGFSCILKISVYLYTASALLPDITSKKGKKSAYKYVFPAIISYFAVCIIRKIPNFDTSLKSPFFAVLCLLGMISAIIFSYLYFFGKRGQKAHG